jgi:heme-degrading monooxygenase HmoA
MLGGRIASALRLPWRQEVVEVLVQIVRYRSRLTDEDVLATVESRATEYLAVPGLLQKYYLRFPETGEHGGVYLWASRESFQGFRESELARTIPDAYRVEGPPHVELADVSKVLHPRCATHA